MGFGNDSNQVFAGGWLSRDSQATRGHLIGDVLLNNFWVTRYRLESVWWLPKCASPVKTDAEPMGQPSLHECSEAHIGVMVRKWGPFFWTVGAGLVLGSWLPTDVASRAKRSSVYVYRLSGIFSPPTEEERRDLTLASEKSTALPC